VDADSSRWVCDPYVANLIRTKARQLVGQYGLTLSDREDVEQDLKLDLLRRAPNFDGSRAGLRTFATRVIDHAVARMIEYRSAPMRDCRIEVLSLQETVVNSDGEDVRLEDLPHEDASLHQRGYLSCSMADDQFLEIALARALTRLTPEQRDLCRQLLASRTMSDIAKAKGISRPRLYEIRREIQRVFEEEGLREYL